MYGGLIGFICHGTTTIHTILHYLDTMIVRTKQKRPDSIKIDSIARFIGDQNQFHSRLVCKNFYSKFFIDIIFRSLVLTFSNKNCSLFLDVRMSEISIVLMLQSNSSINIINYLDLIACKRSIYIVRYRATYQ